MITGAPTAGRATTTRTARAASDMTLRDSRRHRRAAAERRAGAPSAETYARVDKAVHEIDGEVDEDVDHAHEEHEALDGPRVLRHHRRDRVVADAGPREDRLHHHVAGHEEAEDHADQGDDRDHAVPERVAVHDGAPGQSRRPGRLD